MLRSNTQHPSPYKIMEKEIDTSTYRTSDATMQAMTVKQLKNFLQLLNKPCQQQILTAKNQLSHHDICHQTKK
jgi:hypothetical protein